MSELNEAEKSVLHLIRENPFAGQQQLAEALGLSRSAVAAHIVRLIEKGYILGRGYVLPQENRVVAIGGAVIDRKYLARASLIAGTSNPVESMRSFGGSRETSPKIWHVSAQKPVSSLPSAPMKAGGT